MTIIEFLKNGHTLPRLYYTTPSTGYSRESLNQLKLNRELQKIDIFENKVINIIDLPILTNRIDGEYMVRSAITIQVDLDDPLLRDSNHWKDEIWLYSMIMTEVAYPGRYPKWVIQIRALKESFESMDVIIDKKIQNLLYCYDPC